MKEFERRKKERTAKYGYVRPIISTVLQGTRFVAVGSTLHWSKTWKTVPDFLSDYIKTTLGQEWGTSEIQKPLAERHPILQWYDSLCRMQKAHSSAYDADVDGIYSTERNGPAAAYYQLAYDLYVLADHLKLQERLIERLKHLNLFQGARYELSVATHCIRAGFDIEHEDEEDKSVRHPEFIATHKETGQALAVEAKSRHRPGVLGRPGERQEKPKAGVRRILNQALAKSTQLPYAVFVDLNLPPSEDTDIRELGWIQELISEIDKRRDADEDRHPYNLLMFTNHPQHYGADAAPNPASGQVSVLSLKPRIQLSQPQALVALHDAAVQYGNVPNWFDE